MARIWLLLLLSGKRTVANLLKEYIVLLSILGRGSPSDTSRTSGDKKPSIDSEFNSSNISLNRSAIGLIRSKPNVWWQPSSQMKNVEHVSIKKNIFAFDQWSNLWLVTPSATGPILKSSDSWPTLHFFQPSFHFKFAKSSLFVWEWLAFEASSPTDLVDLEI